MPQITYTFTDESPMLATGSLLPVIRSFLAPVQIEIDLKDLSLAGRIIAAFSDQLPATQAQSDDLALLGEMTQSADTNLIKLPNISASLPQLKAAIKELQTQGYQLPDYPDRPTTDREAEIKHRYDQVKGSAVNPVLRQGNSDRRAPIAVKKYAQKHPHRMGAWEARSKTRVATMDRADFAHNEASVVLSQADQLQVTLVPASQAEDTTPLVLKERIPVQSGEIFDASYLSASALAKFLTDQLQQAQAEQLLFSVHLKATMMKVSDPIIFGQVVKAYFAPVFARYHSEIAQLGLNPNDGLGAIFQGLAQADPEVISAETVAEIKHALEQQLQEGPQLAMVDSERGITNLHVPSDVIVDASMPAMIRNSGKMWGADGQLHDTLAVIPDSSYAGIYQATIEDCRENGALDPSTMGSVSNVGLMAQKAEEYGSHDKTFLIPFAGEVQVTNQAGEVLLRHQVEKGDIWRGCQTKDAPIRDWVRLAVERARLTQTPAIFWLNPQRAHDRCLTEKVTTYLAEHDTEGLDLRILDPVSATKLSLQRARAGYDTISVTGNVLRDYNTDLFPILELGTSAKMLSVVPLMAGGGMFETGAGGSAPKHVKQLLAENHLRWDSLGEFLALSESLSFLARQHDFSAAQILSDTLQSAIEKVLENGKSPARKAGQADNRTSHAWLATYWAQALAQQTDSPQLAAQYQAVAQQLTEQIGKIETEILSQQGKPVDLGGYYHPDREKWAKVMCPSQTFKQILATLTS